MSRKLPGSAIVPGSITLTQITGSLNDTTNAAYAQANTARNTANDAYGQANSARSDANTTFATVNTTFGTINTNYQAAYAQANLSYAAANNSNLLSGGLVSGTLNVTQDIIVGGNVYLEGNTTYINVATYSIEDSLVYYASNNNLTDSVDIGFMGGKNTSGTYSHTGFARDATDGKWKLFDGLAEEGHVGNVVDFANTYLATLVANVEANTLTVVNGVSGNVNFDSGTLFVDSVNDRVGIGTTSPLQKLHVNGPRAIIDDGSGTNIGLSVGTTSSSTGSFFGAIDVNGSSYSGLYTRTGDVIRGKFVQLSTSRLEIGTVAEIPVQLHVNDAAVATLTSTGVGIGTTNPNAALHIVKDDNNNSITRFRNSNSTFRKTFIQFEDYNGTITDRFIGMDVTSGTTAGSLMFFGKSTSSYQMVIDNDGNVGIGTTSPAYKLDVNGGIQLNGKSALTNNGYFVGAPSHGFRWNSSDDAYNNVIMYDNGNMYVRGNVGIGTTNPQSKLHVQGSEILVNVSDDWHQSSEGTTLIRGGIQSGTISNDVNAIKIFPATGTRAVGYYNSGISFMHLDPENSTWGASYTGAQAWIGMRITSTAGQELDALVFATNSSTTAGTHPTEKMCILPNGQVGIGTTSPRSLLDIRGGLEINPTNTSGNDQSPTVFGFYHFYKTNAGADYAHLKTNIPTGTSSTGYGMVLIEATGYVYGAAQTIKSMWGFHNWNGTVYSLALQNLGQRAFANTAYVSSDGYIVLTCLVSGGSMYTGARLDFIDIQADYAIHSTHPPQVTSVSYTNSTTGAF